jgi:predicted alpha/beta-fold hydrolase
MPRHTHSSYSAPWWLPGGHAQTIFPSLFRRVETPPFERSRLVLPDRDVLLLDTLRAGRERSRTVVVLSHGLEGNSGRAYMRGMCLAFAAAGWDSAARNFRACGGEMNYAPGMYHSGQTDVLLCVVRHGIDTGYERVLLVGFSMGGNQTLKYLGEDPARVPEQVRGAAAFSVPCNLPGAARVLDQRRNALYMRYFLRTLREKVRRKHPLYPELYPLDGLDSIRTFAEFDQRYTAPAHGFSSAEDYWEKAACLPHLRKIRVPALLVNAVNDPFLSPACYPAAIAGENPFLTLEMPKDGGHVGFTPRSGRGEYWSETRARAFFLALEQ